MGTLGESAPVSKGKLWTGRILSGLVVALLLFDSGTKVMKTPSFMAMAVKMGFAEHEVVVVGWTLLCCIVVYLIPQTAVLGATLLTAYLGGAVAIQLHMGLVHGEMAFPVIVAILAWLGIYLREPRLSALLPLRSR